MSTSALAELDRVLRALTTSERRVVRVLLPHILAAPQCGPVAPLSDTRITIAIPEGAAGLAEAVLGALLALPAVQVDRLSPDAVTVAPLGAEHPAVTVRVTAAHEVSVLPDMKLSDLHRTIYGVLCQAGEEGVEVRTLAQKLDTTSYEVSYGMQILRRRGMAACAKDRNTARWAITQEAADHALGLALGRAVRAGSTT